MTDQNKTEPQPQSEPWFSVLVADAQRRTAGKGDLVHALRDGALHLMYYQGNGRVLNYRMDLSDGKVSLECLRYWLAEEMARHGYPDPAPGAPAPAETKTRRLTHQDVYAAFARARELLNTGRGGKWAHLANNVTVAPGPFDEATYSVGHYVRAFPISSYPTWEDQWDLAKEIAWAAIEPHAKAEAAGRAPWRVGDLVACALTSTSGVVVDTTESGECFVYWNWTETTEKWVPAWRLVRRAALP